MDKKNCKKNLKKFLKPRLNDQKTFSNSMYG